MISFCEIDLCFYYCIDHTEDEKEFDYNKGSDKGPENWGKLHNEWSACGNGNIQSPIDLLDEKLEVLRHLGRLNRSYKASKASLKNRGHDIMVRILDLKTKDNAM